MPDKQQSSGASFPERSSDETLSFRGSRRRFLALMSGGFRLLSKALPPAVSGSAYGWANHAVIRLAISETLVAGVNINDARVAMLIWIKQMETELQLPIELNANVFEPTADILRRARSGLFDAVALNIIEYRLIADLLDSSQIINDTAGAEEYVLLAKRGRGIQKLSDLQGRRLLVLTGTRMCIAHQWLSTILDAAHLPQPPHFFGSVVEDGKAAKIVLPVFFGQADACVTSKRSFNVMCELNPQVAKDLIVIETSSPMVVTFYTFHKNCVSANRDRLARVYSSVPGTMSGKQLSTLFQFNNLTIGNATRLAPALAVLDKAERISNRRGAGSRAGD